MKIAICVFIFFFSHCAPALAYKAAVFEHYPSTSDTPLNTIRKNLNDFRDYADKAKQQSVEILVFPEYGLTTMVDDPQEYAIEVTDDNEIIKEVKAIATERQVYIVLNVLERLQEANRSTKYYNTNLVFDRNGTIILKYRKINLVGEDKLTRGDSNQTLTFTTDFGVTFGIFTGHDIVFDNPSRRVLEDNGVTDVVYPTAWSSVIPFFTSLSVQHGYSLANGVNLLAANYGKPKESHGGSGIYLADGTIGEIYISDSPSSKPLIRDIPKIQSRVDKTICPLITPFGLPGEVGKSNISNYVTGRDFDSSDYKFQNVDLTQKNSSFEVCQGDLCCTFSLVVDLTQTDSSVKYKAMAFDGLVEKDDVKSHLRICSLVACENDSNDSCGKRVNGTTSKFTKITVKGNLKNEDGTFYVPVTLNSFLQPITQTLYCNTNNGTNSSFVQLTTYRAQQDVLVFGLLGKTVSAASSLNALGVLLLVACSMAKYLF